MITFEKSTITYDLQIDPELFLFIESIEPHGSGNVDIPAGTLSAALHGIKGINYVMWEGPNSEFYSESGGYFMVDIMAEHHTHDTFEKIRSVICAFLIANGAENLTDRV